MSSEPGDVVQRDGCRSREYAVVTACVAASGVLFLWARLERLDHSSRPTAFLMFGIVLPGCLWLATRALRRHLRIAERLRGSYGARHAGLVWAVGVWSAVTYFTTLKGLRHEAARLEFVWQLLVRGILGLPIWLWGGLLWLGGVRSALGGDHDRAD
jgi:hypothetical protein